MEYKLCAYIKDIMLIPSDAKTIHAIKAQRRAQERYISVILLCTADHGQAVGCLLQELKKYSLKEQSTLPAILAEALAMINDYSTLVLTPRLMDG